MKLRHRLRFVRAVGVAFAVMVGVGFLATLGLAIYPVEGTTECVGAAGTGEVCETTTLSADWVGVAVLGILFAGCVWILMAHRSDRETR